MDAVALLRSQIHDAHARLDARISAVCETARATHTDVGPFLSTYVRTLCIEDLAVNVLVRDAQPMFERHWVHGLLLPWDLAAMRGYARVVYAATDALLDTTTPRSLDRPIDLAPVDLGRTPAALLLTRFILWEALIACSELAQPPPPTPYSNGTASNPGRTVLEQARTAVTRIG
jgi:hypothetical protein